MKYDVETGIKKLFEQNYLDLIGQSEKQISEALRVWETM